MYNIFLLSKFLENLIFAQNNEFFRKIKIKCRSGNGNLLIDLHGPYQGFQNALDMSLSLVSVQIGLFGFNENEHNKK